jgi:diguanylate cyclase (GGDEF)-like protein
LIGGVEVFTDLSNKKANEFKIMELEKLALLDKLTQIANRNYLERELDSRMDEFRRYGIPFGVLFIDVDHFKSFNDRYGHDVGDRVLQYVAKNMTINARPSDLFGRWGGEEFLGVIRNVTKKEVLNIAERLRILIEKSYIDHLNDHLHVTVSIGGTLVAEKDSVKDLVIRADDQLYKCKKNGRNRVEVD